MTSELSWDEFRLVKAIADARSLVGAAERLGVNHSTVFRRLAAVEAAVGARLFDRSRAGYEPTAAGEDMIALATTMAESIIDFERRVAGRDVKPTGELSVTVAVGVGLHFMPAIVAQFQAANPGVVVELILANEALDLSRRVADVAVRLTNDPPETLVGRRICTARSCVYRRRDIAAEAGAEAVESGAFIGFARKSRDRRRAGGGSRPMSIRDELSPRRIRPTACSSSRFRVSARRCCLVTLAIETRTSSGSVTRRRNSTRDFGRSPTPTFAGRRGCARSWISRRPNSRSIAGRSRARNLPGRSEPAAAARAYQVENFASTFSRNAARRSGLV